MAGSSSAGRTERSSDARRVATIAGLALALVLASAGCWRSVDYDAHYLLADVLPEAERSSGRTIAGKTVELGFDRRISVYQHPPSVFRFDEVPSGAEAWFRSGIGLDPQARDGGSDGVTFELRCGGPAGGPLLLHAQTVVPAAAADARWQEVSISLAGCAAPSTWLELHTGCGPAEQCQADWAFWGRPRVEHRQHARVSRPRLVLLISIDTLRPDHIEPYGGRSTPALARLARDGITFETAVSHAPWTIPSHAALFTSQYPHIVGASAERGIPAELVTLAEVFQEADWDTAGFVDHDWLAQYGFPRGFVLYHARPPARGLARHGVAANQQRLRDWIVGSDRRPAFAFWHIMDVHGPYGAPSPFGGVYRSAVDPQRSAFPPLATLVQLGIHDYLELGRFRTLEDLVAGYDEGIARADAAIGELLDFLAAAGLYEDAVIVVTSDHGESLLEHGAMVGHGLSLREVEIRVPLLVKLPGARHAGTRVSAMVRHIDVAPSILDAAGLAPPPTFAGRSLLTPAPGAAETLPEISFGWNSNTGSMYARTAEWKLISAWTEPREDVVYRHLFPRDETSPLLAHFDPGEKLFELARDPNERNDLTASPQPPEALAALRAALAREQAAAHVGSGPPPALGAAEVERLRALGYVRDAP